MRATSEDIRSIHPELGTSIVRFEKVDDGVYKGSKPKTEADYEFLRSKHIKYILNLRFFPWLNQVEQRRSEEHDMILLSATINASPMEQSERHVNNMLCGRDRAMLITVLYKMYYRGMSGRRLPEK